MDERITQLEHEVAKLKARNKRVDSDKARERSPIRIASIAAITYIVAGAVMRSIGVPNFYLAAFVPVVGFILSTLSMRKIKESWLKNR